MATIRRRPFDRFAGSPRPIAFVVAASLALVAAYAVADGDIKPGSARDSWISATSRDQNDQPLIHSLRAAALELTNRARYRWRVGMSWRFRHATANGMPGAEDRTPMSAIDDAIKRDFERDDEHRVVYFTTGGGIREVMLYGRSEAIAWKRIDALFKQFPDQFPGDRRRWAYVEADPEWKAYRAIQAMVRPSGQ